MLGEYGVFALNVEFVGKADHVAQSGSILRPVDRIELVSVESELVHIAHFKLVSRVLNHLRYFWLNFIIKLILHQSNQLFYYWECWLPSGSVYSTLSKIAKCSANRSERHFVASSTNPFMNLTSLVK